MSEQVKELNKKEIIKQFLVSAISYLKNKGDIPLEEREGERKHNDLVYIMSSYEVFKDYYDVLEEELSFLNSELEKEFVTIGDIEKYFNELEEKEKHELIYTMYREIVFQREDLVNEEKTIIGILGKNRSEREERLFNQYIGFQK